MKIILSRKGFDTTYGQRASPILPNGTLLSIPIPNMRFVSGKLYDDTRYTPIQYRDLHIPYKIRNSLLEYGVNAENLMTYHDLMYQLFPNKQFKDKETWYFLDQKEPLYCHLDPDIIYDILPRLKEWKPIFGQEGSAQSHLENNDVGVGDLFLYYGKFQKTQVIDGKLSYMGAATGGKHIIFGYFQVGSIIKNDETKIKSWMKYHPHLDKEFWDEKKNNNNTIYIAKDKLTFSQRYPGAGCFKFIDKLELTESNPLINPNKNLTRWKYSFIPTNSTISINSEKVGWNEKENYFKSIELGQEMVVSNCPTFREKIKTLFETCNFLDSS